MLQDLWDRCYCVQRMSPLKRIECIVFLQVGCTKVCGLGEQGGWGVWEEYCDTTTVCSCRLVRLACWMPLRIVIRISGKVVYACAAAVLMSEYNSYVFTHIFILICESSWYPFLYYCTCGLLFLCLYTHLPPPPPKVFYFVASFSILIFAWNLKVWVSVLCTVEHFLCTCHWQRSLLQSARC